MSRLRQITRKHWVKTVFVFYSQTGRNFKGLGPGSV
ncbi:hypothetical protein SAMN05443244_1353 [Terriglobus roseus]|uniref:Uncharacterized protein n=1 Tax=Terriglobus roseus TaxID=392734 RepID=A0A1H4KUY5_9BACT|nr:hypothetical protein SAMN05443244_1353 [Terriglobus roseus]